MRIAICEDDICIIEQLTKWIRDFFSKNQLRCPEICIFTDGESLLADTSEKDIVFLDVEMPGMSGIYVGRELTRNKKDIIIFIVTSFTEYLDDAMRFHVFRYLSKPLEKKRFYHNMEDALRLYSTFEKKLAIETRQEVHMVSSADIVMIEARARKVLVHTRKQTYESVHGMDYWRKMLQANCFFQSHRSFIVNMEHISSFDHTVISLYYDQFQAYLTRRKYTAFKDAYLLYLESTQ